MRVYCNQEKKMRTLTYEKEVIIYFLAGKQNFVLLCAHRAGGMLFGMNDV